MFILKKSILFLGLVLLSESCYFFTPRYRKYDYRMDIDKEYLPPDPAKVAAQQELLRQYYEKQPVDSKKRMAESKKTSELFYKKNRSTFIQKFCFYNKRR